jgi:hypothetical protein
MESTLQTNLLGRIASEPPNTCVIAPNLVEKRAFPLSDAIKALYILISLRVNAFIG